MYGKGLPNIHDFNCILSLTTLGECTPPLPRYNSPKYLLSFENDLFNEISSLVGNYLIVAKREKENDTRREEWRVDKLL